MDNILGTWHDLKGKIKAKWGKFTDQDLFELKGRSEQIVGKIQKIYGHTKEKAQEEYEDFKKSL